VASEYNISREDQDAFAVQSHLRAAAAIDNGAFASGIAPITVNEVYLDAEEKRQERQHVIDTDEGVRRGTNPEALAKLRPVFADGGSVTAGNSSQTSDGAAFVMVVSERMLKELGVEPIARLKSYHVSGLEPRIMGMGPVHAVPKALQKAGLTSADIDLYELNEAFASQSVAVTRELDLDPSMVNVHGGAIALGHPLGCTGAKLSVQLLNELNTRKARHGIVTMCVGSGQGAAGVFEMLSPQSLTT
jgi:acetyl-CoA acyltransferase